MAAGAVMMAGVEAAAIPGCVIGSFEHEYAWIGRFTESRFESKTIFRFQMLQFSTMEPSVLERLELRPDAVWRQAVDQVKACALSGRPHSSAVPREP